MLLGMFVWKRQTGKLFYNFCLKISEMFIGRKKRSNLSYTVSRDRISGLFQRTEAAHYKNPGFESAWRRKESASERETSFHWNTVQHRPVMTYLGCLFGRLPLIAQKIWLVEPQWWLPLDCGPKCGAAGYNIHAPSWSTALYAFQKKIFPYWMPVFQSSVYGERPLPSILQLCTFHSKERFAKII